jgi:hypothetical protein
MAALLVALALFVTLVPTSSRKAAREVVSTEELLGTAGSPLASAADDGSGTRSGRRISGPQADRGTVTAVPGNSSWRPTGQDCSRRKLIASPTCRPTPAFRGDNGGVTARNVDADEIRVVAYEPGGNPQVDALLDTFGASSSDDSKNIAALKAYEKFFNERFETYGRRVRILFQRGPGDASIPDEQTADAKAVVEKLRATFVMSAVGSTAFHDEVSRQGITNIAGGLQFPSRFYEERSPNVFGMVPDLDLTLDHDAEYWCKRLNGRPAVHAGDPTYRSRQRKLGIIYPEDNQTLTGGKLLKAKIEACGGSVTKMVSYVSDVSTAAQQATNAIAQLKQAGVTTVTCTCDPLAPIFFTSAATNQGWFPEWIQNGVLLTDLPDFGRLYDQQQWSHSFGITVFGKPTLVRESDAWKAYFAAEPNGDKANVNAAYYGMLLYFFSGIEAAGPKLTPKTFAQALFRIPPIVGKAPWDSHISFGRWGPSPYSAIDDVCEIWWDPTREGPDGKPGWHFYVRGGARYNLGQWPESDPVVFVDDGSPQPERDPDR